MVKDKSMTKRKIDIGLIVIIAIALFTRLYRIGSVPDGLQQDEAFSVWNALNILQHGMDSSGHVFPVYLATWGDGQSALYSWLIMPLLLLTGGEYSGYWLGRIPQALMGVLTVYVVYLLLKEIESEFLGLIGAFLLATCPWHIQMCRWGLDANIAPAFLVFGVYFFVKGIDNHKYYVLAALMYGLSLYGYAVVWLYVPVVVFLQIIFVCIYKRPKIDRYIIFSVGILFVMALPLMLFLLINNGIISEIALPFMSIPKMTGYRGGELSESLETCVERLLRVRYLLWNQDQGLPYDILLPYGLFYDIGRFFIIIGFLLFVVAMVREACKRQVTRKWVVFIQLVGAGIVCCLVSTNVHQTNCLYIPLVIFEAYGVWYTLRFFKERLRRAWVTCAMTVVLLIIYVQQLVCYQVDYHTSFVSTLNAYFAQGTQDAIEYALDECAKKSVVNLGIERGFQWSRMLLYGEISAPEYLSSVVYKENNVEPLTMRKGNVTIENGIDYDNLSQEKIYIFYVDHYGYFAEKYDIVSFSDWYVALPR